MVGFKAMVHGIHIQPTLGLILPVYTDVLLIPRLTVFEAVLPHYIPLFLGCTCIMLLLALLQPLRMHTHADYIERMMNTWTNTCSDFLVYSDD